MRGVAFAFLMWAAFDLPTWHLDRAGCALVGIAFAVLACVQRSSPTALPARPPASVESEAEALAGLSAARIAALTGYGENRGE